MASETQTWWTGHYAKYTLTNLNSMPIYATFKSLQNYFSRSDGTRTETYWTVDNCKIYEWFQPADNKGEKLGLDGWGKTWFYEMWVPEGDHVRTIKTWLKPDSSEWGTIILRFPDKEIHEKWSFINGVKIHEIEETEGSKVTSHKTGFAGADEWTEDRVWHANSSLEKGSAVGIKNGQRFEEKWENNEPIRTETKEFWDSTRNWGNRYRRNGSQWIREDWDGWKPESATVAGPDYSKGVKDNYEEAIFALKDSEATLKLMMDVDHELALESLIASREDLPNPSSIEETIQAITLAHSLLQDHEALRRELISSLPSAADSESALKAVQDKHLDEVTSAMDTLYAIMVKNDAVCDTLAAALKDTETKAKLDRFEDEFERINTEFGDSQDTSKLGEMLSLLLRYQPINYEMAGKLHGISSEQSAQDMTDSGKGGLKQQRAKVRSGRPVSSAFDVISEKLNKDLSLTAEALELFAENEEAAAKSKTTQGIKGDPIETIIKKVEALTEMLEELLSSSALHEINSKSNTHLTLAAEAIASLTDDQSATSKSQEAQESEGLPLSDIRKKMELLEELLKTLSALQANQEQTETETRDTIQETYEESLRTIEKRENEIVQLKTETEKKDHLVKRLQEDIARSTKESAGLKEIKASFEVLKAENERLKKQLAAAE